MEVGGTAECLMKPRTYAELEECLQWAAKRHLKTYILGAGTNVVFSQKHHDLAIVRPNMRGMTATETTAGMTLTIGASEPWQQVVDYAVRSNLSGIECLTGIPGLSGSVPVQNVGAYGQQISDVLESVLAYDLLDQRVTTISRSDCSFGYRKSIFNTACKGRYCILSLNICLSRESRRQPVHPDIVSELEHDNTILAVERTVRSIRLRKGTTFPDWSKRQRTAGSFFKNPRILRELALEVAELRGEVLRNEESDLLRVPAAWLIELAGFRKGFTQGRVGLSPHHVLSIENLGGATADEVFELSVAIQAAVMERTGVLLEPEPDLVGFESNDPGV